MNRKNIGDLLLSYKLIDESDLKEALEIQKNDKSRRIGEILVDLKKVTEDDIQYLISKQLNIPFVFLRDITLDENLIKKFSKDFLIKNRIIPLYETEDKISIATNDPFNTDAIDKIASDTGKSIMTSACSSKDILNKLKAIEYLYFDEIKEKIDELMLKLKGTSFYRIDFVYFKGSLDINIYGTSVLHKYCNISSGQIDKKVILNYFKKIEVDFFNELYNSKDGFTLLIYPVIEYCSVDFINEFGKFPNKFPVVADLSYEGNNHIIKSDNPIVGYKYLSFNKYIKGEDIINLIDNFPVKPDKPYLKPYICNNCSGKKCELCGYLGYRFEVYDGQN